MTINVVRFDEVIPQRWKNGGGVTRELLAWPNANEWAIRLSVADIERDGSFSTFPGVERWFAVLSGNGVRLGVPAKLIKRGDDAVNFDGALAPNCTLIDNPTRDLNLMIRRDVASGWMKRITAGFEFPAVDASALLSGVFAVDGCTLRPSNAPTIAVLPMSLVWCGGAGDVDRSAAITCDASALVFGFQCVVNS
jgi:uncharacterized protein